MPEADSTNSLQTVKPYQRPAIKLQIFERATEAFPDGRVAVMDYAPGHSKLSNRDKVHPHIGVRVAVINPKSLKEYAVAGMVPVSADAKAVDDLIAHLLDDQRRAVNALNPVYPEPPLAMPGDRKAD